MHFRLFLPATIAGFAALLASCSDQTDPATSAAPDPDPSLVLRQGTPDDPNSLARAVPGFGGMFFDAQGQATVYLKDPGQRANTERALAPFLQSRGVPAGQVRVLRGDFDWVQLERWQGAATTEALAVPGAVFVDADEASNRVRIGVERGAAGRVRAALARAGLPDGAVIVEEREPVTFAVGQGPGSKPRAKPGSGSSLQGAVRPIIGGVQINFPGFLCTLGFNVGGGSFITNSHCTNTQGGTEGTPYWQPSSSASAQIATESADPIYRTGLTGCPAGRVCRFSDASRASYAGGAQFAMGRIARTQRPGRGLNITGQFTITGEGAATVGTVVNKVGRTTGWSQGNVTNTCVHTNVSGSNITQLCQNFVSATVGSGDSGSPVFQILSGDDVRLVGILWGGSGSQSFVYSPLSNIEMSQELGALTTQ